MLAYAYIYIYQTLLSKVTYIQAIHFFCQYMCSLGIEPTTFELLTQCSTTEPQEHLMLYIYVLIFYTLIISNLHIRMILIIDN